MHFEEPLKPITRRMLMPKTLNAYRKLQQNVLNM